MKTRAVILARSLCLSLAGSLAFTAAGSAVHAQTLADPTRPPAVLGVQGGAGGEGGESGTPAAPVLQSILVSREPGGRRVAVINGEMVRQGMKVGDAIVERVGETEVVLRRGKTRETLKLFAKP